MPRVEYLVACCDNDNSERCGDYPTHVRIRLTPEAVDDWLRGHRILRWAQHQFPADGVGTVYLRKSKADFGDLGEDLLAKHERDLEEGDEIILKMTEDPDDDEEFISGHLGEPGAEIDEYGIEWRLTHGGNAATYSLDWAQVACYRLRLTDLKPSETAKNIAKGIVEKTAPDRLPILADALGDQGGWSNELLDYFRLCGGENRFLISRNEFRKLAGMKPRKQ